MSRSWIILLCVLMPSTALSINIPPDDLDPFGAPCDLSVQELVPGSSRTMTWSSVSGASSYKAGRIPCSGTIEGLAEVTGTSYTDSSFDANECYKYVVVAYDSSGDKICSAQVVGIGQCPCP